MELDIEGQLADQAYPILASLAVPRPIALVTTIGPGGKVNAAPFSFFNVLGADPPIVAVAPGDRGDGTPKDTARNIRLTHEFVVNLVDEDLAEAMNNSIQRKSGCTGNACFSLAVWRRRIGIVGPEIGLN